MGWREQQHKMKRRRQAGVLDKREKTREIKRGKERGRKREGILRGGR